MTSDSKRRNSYRNTQRYFLSDVVKNKKTIIYRDSETTTEYVGSAKHLDPTRNMIDYDDIVVDY